MTVACKDSVGETSAARSATRLHRPAPAGGPTRDTVPARERIRRAPERRPIRVYVGLLRDSFRCEGLEDRSARRG
ncbi:MAG: hypothetical protein EBT21_07265, partial [Actinobacteria bacterium]|nr:hypothetical protein [Actinomycetota bacterium]